MIKKTVDLLCCVVGLFMFSFSMSAAVAPHAYADTEKTCADGRVVVVGSDGDPCGGFAPLTKGNCNSESGECITSDIQILINVLSIAVGVVVTLMIVIAGIQYTLSRDNPQAVQAAKTRITNSLIALIAYVFIFAFLQWIVPGGLF